MIRTLRFPLSLLIAALLLVAWGWANGPAVRSAESPQTPLQMSMPADKNANLGDGPTVRPMTPIYTTNKTTLQLDGIQPDTAVRLYASPTGIGDGPCLGDHCLDLLPPVSLLGEVTADANGTAEIDVVFAPGDSAQLYVQAAQLAPVTLGPVTPIKVWERKRVLMIGDSITEGQQSNPKAYQYTDVAGLMLGDAYEVIEAGCGGATTYDWATLGEVTLCGGRFWNPDVYTRLALPHLPADLATVMLGTNDATGFFEPAPITPEQYQANLTAIVNNLLQDGAAQVLLLSPPPMCDTANPEVVARLEAYRLIIGQMCAAMPDVTCGPDVYTLLDADDFQGCDVHPNGIGHLDLGIAVAHQVEGMLQTR